jgi:type IV secretory pathway VirD2 relaxase
MTQVEQDLGTKLDWVAVDQFNAERLHTQILLRGGDDPGDKLVIAREYISHGLCERASELVTLDLGPVPIMRSRRGCATMSTRNG